MKYLFLGAAVLVLAACETTPYEPFISNAQSPDRSERVAASESKEKVDPDGMRCENITVIGSRTPSSRVCRTEEEWARMRENAQEIAREMERIPIPTDPTN